MNKNIIIALVVGIIIIGGGIFFLSTDTQSPGTQTADPSSESTNPPNQGTEQTTAQVTTHEIVLGENGYAPQEILINIGDSIEFSTTVNAPFWPASAIHPTHGIYPEFDPKEEIPAGETWTFKFDEAGEWQYHDHLNPSITGTIRVVD